MTSYQSHMMTYMIANDIKIMMTLHNASAFQKWNHKSWSKEHENFSKSCSIQSNQENKYPHFEFLSATKKVISIWKFEVGSGKSAEKAEDIQLHRWEFYFHKWNTTFYIFTILLFKYSKPVLSSHLKIDKTKVFKTNGSWMKVESIAECSLGAFCNSLTCIKQ